MESSSKRVIVSKLEILMDLQEILKNKVRVLYIFIYIFYNTW